MSIVDRAVVLFRAWFFHRLFWYALAWILAFNAAGMSLWFGWISFNIPYRPDGNEGHATIDFGGQYLMGRMLVKGHGRELYNRYVQRGVLEEAYPNEPDTPRAFAVILTPLAATDPFSFVALQTARQGSRLDDHNRELGWPDEKVRVLGGLRDAEMIMTWVMGGENDDSNVARAFAVGLTPLAARDPFGFVGLELAREESRPGYDGQETAWPDSRVAELGGKRSVGGPLYPPINAFFYSPLALMEPQVAYRVNQVVNVLLVFVAALGISVVTRGHVWCPTAAIILYIFAGTAGSINLGQNAVLTLVIAVWGWVLVSRGKPGWAGVVWGLLAFKPVWALALFLVPLLTGRLRMCLTMVLTGTALAVATLPFVGVHSWFEWLQVGRAAAKLYNTDENWIFLSRDLLGIPRRFLLYFGTEPGKPREILLYPPADEGLGQVWHWVFGDNTIPPWLWPALMGWLLLGVVLEVTVRTAVLRRREVKAVVGPPAAFLFLGAWMLCYHFMYYDVLLAALPVMLLWHDPAEFFRPIYLVLYPGRGSLAGHDFGGYHRPRLLGAMPPPPPPLPLGYRNVWVLNRMVPTLTVVLLFSQYLLAALGVDNFYRSPRDTLLLMALWAWCLVLWFLDARKADSSSHP